jgi:hypothetical protein
MSMLKTYSKTVRAPAIKVGDTVRQIHRRTLLATVAEVAGKKAKIQYNSLAGHVGRWVEIIKLEVAN